MASFLFWVVLPCGVVAFGLRWLYKRERSKAKVGIVTALHDFEFGGMVAPRLVKTIYKLAYVLTAFVSLVWMLFGVSLAYVHWIGWVLPTVFIVGTPLVGLTFLTFTRVLLEYMIVIFSINDRLGILVKHGHSSGSDSAEQSSRPNFSHDRAMAARGSVRQHVDP